MKRAKHPYMNSNIFIANRDPIQAAEDVGSHKNRKRKKLVYDLRMYGQA